MNNIQHCIFKYQYNNFDTSKLSSPKLVDTPSPRRCTPLSYQHEDDSDQGNQVGLIPSFLKRQQYNALDKKYDKTA